MFDYLRREIFHLFEFFIFLHPKLKRPSAMVYILSNFENSEDIYKEVTSPMSGYQCQSKYAGFTVELQY